MIGKRFDFREVHNGGIIPLIWDHKRQEYANLFECLDWLNALNDENEQLKERNQELFDDLQNETTWLSLREGEVAILRKENDRLQCKIELLENTIDMLKGEKELVELTGSDLE